VARSREIQGTAVAAPPAIAAPGFLRGRFFPTRFSNSAYPRWRPIDIHGRATPVNAKPGGELEVRSWPETGHLRSARRPAAPVSRTYQVAGRGMRSASGAMNGLFGPGYDFSIAGSTQGQGQGSITVSAAAGSGTGIEGGPYVAAGISGPLATPDELGFGNSSPLPFCQ
jgi:hypothetical protein